MAAAVCGSVRGLERPDAVLGRRTGRRCRWFPPAVAHAAEGTRPARAPGAGRDRHTRRARQVALRRSRRSTRDAPLASELSPEAASRADWPAVDCDVRDGAAPG